MCVVLGGVPLRVKGSFLLDEWNCQLLLAFNTWFLEGSGSSDGLVVVFGVLVSGEEWNAFTAEFERTFHLTRNCLNSTVAVCAEPGIAQLTPTVFGKKK